MKEYLSFREETLLTFIKNHHLNTLEVKFVLPQILAHMLPFNDFTEVVKTAMALEIRNYITLKTITDNTPVYKLEITLTEKALNELNKNI